MNIICPHCSLVNEDELEVCNSGTATAMHCERCSENYFFLLCDCDRCGAETSISWAHEPNGASVDALTCCKCGLPIVSETANSDDEHDALELLSSSRRLTSQ